MHVLSSTPRISRRHALRSLGVSLALPALECMRSGAASLSAAVRAAEGGKRAARSVFIYLPNGVNNYDWQIRGAGPGYTMSNAFAVLEKHRRQITPISGLHHPNGIGHHHNCEKIWLTGARIGEAEKNTISADQLIAQKTAQQTRFASLEMGNGWSLAWNADGITLPAERNPATVFKSLFEEPAGGIDAQRRRLQRKESILDVVLEEARGLERQLGSADRGRLEQYLTSVREVEVRAKRAESWLDTPRPKIESAVAERLSRDVRPDDKFGEYLRTMYDIIVLAFQTDVTRVVTFSTGSESHAPAIPEIGISQQRHALSHHGGNPTLLADLAKSDRFNLEQLGYFLTRLGEVQDAEGPLLDTSMVLYGSGMAYGHSHGNANLPLVLAGGSGLGLRHGSHVDFNLAAGHDYEKDLIGICFKPVDPRAHMSNLLLTMAQRMGIETESFGDSTRELTEVVA
jgi:hypothetical protein